MTAQDLTAVSAGWYADPTGQVGMQRYYDGTTWTDQVRRIEVTLRPRSGTGASPAPVVPVWAPSVPSAPTAPAPTSRLPAPGGAPAMTPVAAPTSTAQPAATTSSSPAAPPGPASTEGRERRSLAAALSSQFAHTSQALLVGSVSAYPDALRVRDQRVEPGWYPDPARHGALRFYDGTQWTARSRPAPNPAERKLPAAALALRAKILQAQDHAALKRRGRPSLTSKFEVNIPAARATPSLHRAGRTRSGSVAGQLSLVAVVAGLAATVFFAWQLWGSNLYTDYQQHRLRAELQEQVGAETLTPARADWADRTPVDVPAPAAPATPAQPAPAPTAPGSSPVPPAAPAAPRLNEPAADLTPWPPAGWTAPAGRSVPAMPEATGAAVGRMVIPAVGLDTTVVAGTGVDDLKKGPGLWRWGAFPGTPGNTTISGHRTTYGAPFRKLDRLEYGDQIIIEVPGQPRAVYEVRGRVIASPFDVHVTRQGPGVRLTLTTCHPVHSAAERMVIQAEMVEGAWLDKTVNRSAWTTMG